MKMTTFYWQLPARRYHDIELEFTIMPALSWPGRKFPFVHDKGDLSSNRPNIYLSSYDQGISNTTTVLSAPQLRSSYQFIRSRERAAMDSLHPPIPTPIANPAQAVVENSSQRPLYGSYNLPDDDQERARLDLQHELLRATFGGMLYLSPLLNPRSILDVGTGTGVWGSDMAKQFPDAKLVGFDMNLKIPPNLPENFRYTIGDFEDPWPVEEATFDYVHARMVVIAMKDHRKFIGQAFKTLKPGAWFELQDFSVPFANTTGLMAEWNEYYLDGNRRLGLDMSAAEHGWEDWLQEAGFENVQHQRFEWHFASAPTDPEATKLARLARRNLTNALEGISTRVLTQGLGWSKPELDAYLEKIRGAIEEMPSETYLPIHAIYAQKPHRFEIGRSFV